MPYGPGLVCKFTPKFTLFILSCVSYKIQNCELGMLFDLVKATQTAVSLKGCRINAIWIRLVCFQDKMETPADLELLWLDTMGFIKVLNFVFAYHSPRFSKGMYTLLLGDEISLNCGNFVPDVLWLTLSIVCFSISFIFDFLQLHTSCFCMLVSQGSYPFKKVIANRCLTH